MTQGFVMLNRELANKMKDLQPFDYKLLMTVITNCVYIEQYEHNGLILNRGEWFRSLSKIQNDLSYIENNEIVTPSIKKIRCILARLQGQGFLSYKGMNKGMNKGMVITLHETLVQLIFPSENDGTRAGTRAEARAGNVVELGQQNNKVINNNNKVFNNKVLNNKTTTTKKDSVNMLDSESNFADVFLSSYGKYPSAIQIQEFLQYIEDGIEEALICHAIRYSAKMSTSIAYLWSVLGNWAKAGIKTLESAITASKKNQKQVQDNDRINETLNRLYDKYSDLNW